MEDKEKEIIESALALFNKFGLRSVTMDDVAREMGISKKTIYQFFENKADLVRKCMRGIFETAQDTMKEIHKKHSNPIDELIEIDEVVCGIVKKHNPGLQFQLQKYYPSVCKMINEGRHQLVHQMIAENIEMGQKGGWYRKDASKEVISFLYCTKMESAKDEKQELYDQFDIPYIMHQSLVYHIRGLATAKGLAYLEEKLKNPKTQPHA